MPAPAAPPITAPVSGPSPVTAPTTAPVPAPMPPPVTARWPQVSPQAVTLRVRMARAKYLTMWLPLSFSGSSVADGYGATAAGGTLILVKRLPFGTRIVCDQGLDPRGGWESR